jgi:nitrogen fixation protein NifU and related proteins
MAYSDKVLDHYENPRNVGSFDKNDPRVGTGMVGAPACGDVMKLHIKVGDDGVIEEARFKTYGCGSAIASSSLVTEWLRGKTLEQARQIKNTDIADELALPPVKIHCSVLAEDAIKAAIGDYLGKRSAHHPDRPAGRPVGVPMSADPSIPVLFSFDAVCKVRELIVEEGNPNLMLRVSVSGGGCSGLQYGFAFEEGAKAKTS